MLSLHHPASDGADRALCKTRTVGPWDNGDMTLTSLRQPHEQRRVEELLVKLAKIKPISARPAPIMSGLNVRKTA